MATLRSQIVSSSPALRALASELQACSLNRDNRASVANKEAQRVMMEAQNKEYAEVLKKLDSEEQLASTLTLAQQQANRLKNQRVLQDQMAEKAALRAKEEADKVVEMMCEVDEKKLMKRENEEQARQKQKNQHATQKTLMQQSQIKLLRQKEQELMDQQVTRLGEKLQLRDELAREVKKVSEEAIRLQYNQRERTLVSKLERQQREQEAMREARLEIACLEKEEEEQRHSEERLKRETAARVILTEGLNQQIKYKRQLKAQEQAKEEEYRKLVMEILKEEGKLDCLGKKAQRRRAQDHQELVDRLMEDRRARRAAAVSLQQHETQAALKYHQIRSCIEEEAAKEMLMRDAPHLLHHLTPKLLAQLKQFTDT
ncbi:hypothetical protein Pcinc_015178 [Petrolisthes cinctipes]|uniref:Meiosis-specific nuclear structural protein 1 n=1 Tax=Petrolisthes cinctipes TaxID=88211 RepID=A0AAE1KQP7_PETCI|nr:hypothetical protein Pcinc_015178 [Petrolisthes cinctipes]